MLVALIVLLLAGCAGHGVRRGARVARGSAGHTELADLKRLAGQRPRTLAFATVRDGLLSTDGGLLFRTDDGGDTWMRLPLHLRLDSLRFVSRQNAFGTASGCRRHRCAVRLVETKNAGTSWRSLGEIDRYREDVDSSPGANTIFVDRSHGFRLGGGGVLATRDGGRTWRAVFRGCGDFGFGGLDFLDEQRGYVMCGSQPATIEMLKSLYATTDGGSTWHLVERSHLFASPRRRLKGDIPTQGHVAGIRFRSPRDGLMIVHRVGVDLTRDGGHHWRTIVGAETGLFVDGVEWPARNRIYALLTSGEVIRSDDRGRHWRSVIPQSASPPIGPIAFASARNGIGIGRNDWEWDPRAVLSTRDGGRTWSRRGELPRLENATGIVLEGRNRVWVTGYTVPDRPRVFRSVDSGRTWTRVAVPVGSFAAISIPRPGLVYLMNMGGLLFRSRDDGVHWSRVSDAHRDLRDFAFASANDGYALEHNPGRGSDQLLHSVDGGRSWKAMKIRMPFKLSRFAARGADIWLLGTRCPAGVAGERLLERQPDCPGGIVRTRDSGRHWEVIRLNMVPGFEGLTFSSERDGFAGDPANGFYRTHDGGRTWAYVYPPPIR